ncbi:pyrimidine reductase family protein [Cryobacterium melibiosiphilum]|uniref:Pyrimidine reductase family protein n=1 Tax=Cryobacterium melibiosiphilum TaxID=995039 RepID=A0A3A5MC45_9MICO|nr:pyrimidine reductase family protein [Cryobacterium melibiosiphilum]RJT86183.1 pyrimidine reductase family protein [Cryobacterium melibiosiphilum]
MALSEGFTRAELLERYALPDRTTPRVRLNFVASLDGAATLDGVSGGLGTPADRAVFNTLRALTDVILVGAGTVRAEGYGGPLLSEADAAWRVAQGFAPQPPLAIVSGRLDLDPGHPSLAEAVVRPIVVTHAGSPVERRAALAEVADVLVCGAEVVEPRLVVAALAARGLTQILCEGGPSLVGALIEADAVDELCLTLSPVLEGGAAGRIAHGGSAARAMTLVHALPEGDTLLLRYARA